MKKIIYLLMFVSYAIHAQTVITLNHIPIQVEVVTTSADQEQGLSGRPSLNPNSGMLFVFPTEGYYKFWMHKMLFPLDIIWLDKNYHVVMIKENLPPCSILDCPVYVSDKPAQYVLEVNAGWVRLNHVSE